MATNTVHQHNNISPAAFLLFLHALILAANKATAVPTIQFTSEKTHSILVDPHITKQPSFIYFNHHNQNFVVPSIENNSIRRLLSTEETPPGEETHVRDEEVPEDSEEEEEEEEDDEGEEEEDDEEEQLDEDPTEEENDERRDGNSAETDKLPVSADTHQFQKHTNSDGNSEELSNTVRTAAGEGVKEQGEHSENSSKTQKDKGGKVGGSKKRGSFRGVSGGVVDGTNITNISYMLYKIVKKYDIKTVLDIPCRNNLNWFPKIIPLLDFEVMGFTYICVDEGADTNEELQLHFSKAGSVEFLSVDPERSEELPQTDLVFSYDGPQQWGLRKTWAFFTGLRKVRPKYTIVTNNPGMMTNDKRHILNLRKQPFHFTQPMRVFANIHTRGDPKQLVFYETEKIREGF